jgi:thiol-disulfide isomerase/thioredoxin
MKHLLLFIIGVSTFVAVRAQTGYQIDVQLKPYKNTQVYLGYYYGEVRALADSAKLDAASKGTFKGKEPLPGGIYFIVTPSKQIMLELLIDKDQRFSISADSANLPASVKFSGSEENRQFQEYSLYTGTMGMKVNQLNQQLATAKTKKDSADINSKVRTYTTNLQKFRDSISKKYPGSFLEALLKAMQEPNIPPATQHPGGKYDSNFVYHYYKDHYWDDMSYTDDRMARTPFFESKLEKYYRDLVSPNPDSLIKEIDHMLLYSRASKEMYKFLMVHFVQKYINPQYMGQDAVFVHLFEKYINANKAEFFTPQYKDFAAKRAYSLMANLIGRQAPQLYMIDSLNKPKSLYSGNSKFTVVVFWDPTCSHCKEIVPKVDSIYEAAWKNLGVQVYAVKTDGTREQWLNFIKEHHLNGWTHVFPEPGKDDAEIAAGRPGYKQLYDVYQTPMLYLLDKDKRIIAKKLTYLQINEVINSKLQTEKAK